MNCCGFALFFGFIYHGAFLNRKLATRRIFLFLVKPTAFRQCGVLIEQVLFCSLLALSASHRMLLGLSVRNHKVYKCCLLFVPLFVFRQFDKMPRPETGNINSRLVV